MRGVILGLGLGLAWTGWAEAQTFGDGMELVEVQTGLSGVLAVRNAGDGSNRLFFVQQGGVIRWADANGTLQPTPFFDITSSSGNLGTCAVAGLTATSFGFSGGSGERGLLGLAFHPDFGVGNQYFFVHFSDSRGDTLIARFTANGNSTNYASCRVVLRIDQDFSNHNGGNIAFGPDGYLYIGMGDGGSGGDPCNRGQTLSPSQLPGNDGTSGCAADSNFTSLASGNPDSRALLGKMLRLDIEAETTAANATGLCGKRTGGTGGDVVAFYAIPNPMGGPANPFAGADPQSACDETWDYGLRNPWRFSFDRSTGDLIIGDVGQGTTEEVDLEPAGNAGGRNYGWRVCEGPYVSGSGSTPCGLTGAVAPILWYAHSAGRCSITGGYRYRGPATFFQGTYVYSDYCTSELFLARETAPGVWASQLWENPGGGVAGFGEDESGRVYVAAGSSVHRIQESVLFADGFE